MDSRRDFLKKAVLLSGSAGLATILPDSIQRAMAINPAPGSTYLDAEHVVILMQENRSFDHCFGTLNGVRGFNDPRAISLPDKNLVWMQTNDAGETYLPFRLDIQQTKATWIGSVPHSRSSQIDANNFGKYDKWLQAKRVRDKKYADMPLTLGYYSREDIPFYYAMADAFTVCDQNFASAITSTRPNRLFLWTGTIREKQNGQSSATIRNGLDFEEAKWDTFPERLEDQGISWKFYQNDIDCGGGFSNDERAWLANFGCNPMEWFANYKVKFSLRYIKSLQKQVITLPEEIGQLKTQANAKSISSDSLKKIQTAINKKQEVLNKAIKELADYSPENYDKLSQKEKSLHQRAFTNNVKDSDYQKLTTLKYEENGVKRELEIPKGDLLYQFRQDVEQGNLPAVSWLAGAQNLSSHPSAPWYGSLYASEILNILTQNPEVFKKTIFIITFDENDGYFDHVPPFLAPDPLNPQTGKCTPGVNTDVEYIRRENELKEGIHPNEAREGPVGLGYRVPLIVASPWSRGGQVCSELYDHTSILQFMEGFIEKKFGKDVKEKNISDWRRAVTGDLTSIFKPYDEEKTTPLPFLEKDPFFEKIYNAKFKKDVTDLKPLTKQQIHQINQSPSGSPLMPKQEKGIRPACALPYQLYAEGKLTSDKKNFELTFAAQNEIFGKKAAGSPFNVYMPGKYAINPDVFDSVGSRSYAVVAGSVLTDSWPVQSFENGIYHLRTYGPNGFFREFKGTADDPGLSVRCEYEHAKSLVKKLSGNVEIRFANLTPSQVYEIEIIDNAYHKPTRRFVAKAGKKEESILNLNLEHSHGWYDFSIKVLNFEHFEKRYAGHVENGRASFSDPAMA